MIDNSLIATNNLFGVAGKKQHGKNSIASILQYLDSHRINRSRNSLGDLSFNNWVTTYGSNVSAWETKSFAGKLKEITSMLLGCTIEQLEDNVYKETELGHEWWYYKVNNDIISLDEYNNLSDNQKGYWSLIKTTPRLLLQLLGTDCGRKIIHPNIWLNALFADYKTVGGVYPKWVVADVRFPNECEAIKKRGGKVIKIINPRIVSTDEHESETALDNYTDFDITIINDGTFTDLIHKVRNLLF